MIGAWRLDLPIGIESMDNESDGETSEGESEIELSNKVSYGSSSSECSSSTISD